MLVAAARALQRALGLPVDAVDPRTREPGRILLGSVLTPQEPEVFAALGLYPAGSPVGWIASVIGAIVVLFLYGLATKKG